MNVCVFTLQIRWRELLDLSLKFLVSCLPADSRGQPQILLAQPIYKRKMFPHLALILSECRSVLCLTVGSITRYDFVFQKPLFLSYYIY